MKTLIQDQLNPAQKQIYSISNLGRAFPDFKDTAIAGIYLRDDSVVVVYQDGAEQLYPKQNVITAYQEFTFRLKDFFSYLGPNYRGPSMWHNNSYIMFKGWHYQHQLGAKSDQALFQREWIDKFIYLKDKEKLKALLQGEHTDLGHLVAPDGFFEPDEEVNLNSSLEDTVAEQEQKIKEPYCSCGSFQQQLLNLSDFQQEIEGYKPQCIHLTWFKKYRELLVKRTIVRDQYRGSSPDNACAWWYAPPADHTSKGRFLVLYTKSGSMAPLSHWRTYKPDEHYAAEDVWTLFDAMLDAGFVPFPGTSLSQLSRRTNGNTHGCPIS